MKEYLVKLAEEIQKSNPEAKFSVILEVSDTSPESIELLSSEGLEIHGVINSLNVVTGKLPATHTKAISKLPIVIDFTTSQRMELLKG